MAQNTANPLEKFYRKPKFSIKLPSRGMYYKDGIVEFDDENEVSVLPMTAADEIMLRNPDALLTGKAVSEVIKSCVPAVKEPRKMLACDIDVLMIAIRRASYGDEQDMVFTCPNKECNHANTYGLDLEVLLNQTETLEESYEVVLPEGLTIFLSPGTFQLLNKQNQALFENAKVQRALRNTSLGDDAAMVLLSKTFNTLAKMNFDLVADSIDSIVFTEDDGNEVSVTDPAQIRSFLQNIQKSSADMIDDKISEINKVGVSRKIDATCTECGHKWEAPLEFNPVNFS